ncbi:hypothetical protein RCL1_002746 [Eukaryota sp. TZLM3-RCL]
MEDGHAAAVMQFPVVAMTRGRVNPKELAQLKKSQLIAEGLTREKPTVYWLHGPTGSGKSRFAHSLSTNCCKVFPSGGDQLKWFEPYDGTQEVVIFDDFSTSWLPLHALLNLTDRYWVMVEVKGAKVYFDPGTIVITSCFSPTETYSKVCTENLAQLLRRIDFVVNTELFPFNGQENYKFESTKEKEVTTERILMHRDRAVGFVPEVKRARVDEAIIEQEQEWENRMAEIDATMEKFDMEFNDLDALD